MNNSLEIFRAGNHRAMNGTVLDFSEDTVHEIVDGYDPALHEAPLVVGHPKANEPAYGWVSSLDYADGVVVAEPDQVDAEFADMVNDGRFKKISASFFTPNNTNNPTPGKYYLRHVGFLGAQPPAVKGLKSASFADEEGTITIEFGEGSYRDRSMAGLFRSLREFIIEKFGTDAADKALPSWQLESVADSATAENAREDANNPASFSDPEARIESDKPKDQETPEMDPNKTDEQETLAAREAAVAKREQEMEQQAADFAERERKAARDANEDFLSGLIEDGKLAPGQKDGVLSFMDSLSGLDEVSFAEGEDEKSPLEFFKGLISAGNQVIDLAEHSAADDDPDAAVAEFAVQEGDVVDADRLELHNKIVALSQKEGITYEAALSRFV